MISASRLLIELGFGFRDHIHVCSLFLVPVHPCTDLDGVITVIVISFAVRFIIAYNCCYLELYFPTCDKFFLYL